MLNIIKNYKKCYIRFFLFSLFFNIVFISQTLTNVYDGLWNGVAFSAGKLEFSTGRWMLPYLDRLHLSMHLEPITSCVTLALVLLSAVLILDIFKVKGLLAYFVALYIMTGTVVTCILSYRYTAMSYGLCILLSVAAVWILTIKNIGRWRYMLSCAFVVLSLCIYQDNIAVTAVLMIFIFIDMLLNGRSAPDIWEHVIASSLIIVAGCIIYRVIAVLHMSVLDIVPSTYMGADEISVRGMILALPDSIAKCYDTFRRYFFTDGFIYYNIFQRFGIFRYVFVGFMVLIAVSGIWRLIQSKRYINAVLVLLSYLVLPIACNLSLLFAVKAGVLIQMTFALALVFPLMLCVANMSWLKSLGRLAICGFFMAAAFFTYGNAWQSTRDIDAMYEGRIASRNLVEHVADKLIREDLLSTNRKYVFIGCPADNETLFVTTNLFERTNAYARYGEFWTAADCMRMSYCGILRDISVNMPLVTDDVYESMRYLPEIEAMPKFPDDGSIKEINGYVVVKVGD